MDEQLFTVNGATATPARRISLTEAGLREREHLQEWVLAHPEILGQDVLIITFEFDRWMTGAGAATAERLDVLALDRSGRLVLAELKRDRAPDAVMVQALNYAAMVSRFTVDGLADAYAARLGTGASTDEIVAELRDWAPAIADETLSPPRIVLVAEDFGHVLTNTAMFLIEQGLDLRLVRVQLYRLGETLALTTSQLLPVPDAEEFMVRPRSGPATQRSARAAASRRASIPERLVAAAVISEGDPLQVVVPAGVQEDRETISAWLDAERDRSMVRWRQDARTPVTWEADGRAYNLTTLVKRIIELATGDDPQTQPWGPNWYRTQDGTVLHKLAEELPDPTPGRFDWAGLHRILAEMPAGRWTTYGDLAAAVGTGPQALGQHVTGCDDCPNAHRILGAGGRPRSGFRFTDSEQSGSQQDLLEAEGIRFESGVADPSRQLSPGATSVP